MIKKLKIIIILSLVFQIISFNSFALTETERLKNDEIIIEDSVNRSAKAGSVKMTFMVHAQPDKIWNLLVQYDKWPSFMPDLEKVVIRENKPDHAVVYVKAKAPLGLDISYVLKRLYNKKNYLITWTMLEGRAKDVQGSWQIFPLSDGHCKVVYINFVDLGFMVSPKIVAMLTKSKLPNLANGIKTYLKTNK